MLNDQNSSDEECCITLRHVDQSLLLGANRTCQPMDIVLMLPAVRTRIRAFNRDFATAAEASKLAAEAFCNENDRYFVADATQLLMLSGLSPVSSDLDEELEFVTKRDACVAQYKEYFAELSVKLFQKHLCQKYQEYFLQDGSQRLADEMELRVRRLEDATRFRLRMFGDYPLQDFCDLHFD